MAKTIRTMVLLSLGLCGCELPPSLNPLSSVGPQSSSASSASLAWARNDGRLISESHELTVRAQTDSAECLAAAPQLKTGEGAVGEGCMNERGYHAIATGTRLPGEIAGGL
jgi:hypothetical protein